MPNQVVSCNELMCPSVWDLPSEPVRKDQFTFCKLLLIRRYGGVGGCANS